jgi:NAD dependent epimerase/dehydratase family enzyme
LGLGSPLGSGKQYMSWIHIDDLVEEMLFASREHSVDGPLNGVAPHPVTNREFTKTLGRLLNRPTFMPAVPPLALKFLIGDFGEVLLDSQRAVPRAALAAGFKFQFSELEPALRDVSRR